MVEVQMVEHVELNETKLAKVIVGRTGPIEGSEFTCITRVNNKDSQIAAEEENFGK